MSTCGIGSMTREQHLMTCPHPPNVCDYRSTNYDSNQMQVWTDANTPVYKGSALNHPDSTLEFKNRTHKRRAKNKVAKQSRRRNR